MKKKNYVHVQTQGVYYKKSVFPKPVSLLNPRVRAIFGGFFLQKEPGKSLEVRFDFDPRPGFSSFQFNFLWLKILNYIAEADADLIPVQGQLELHGRCRCGVLPSRCFGALL